LRALQSGRDGDGLFQAAIPGFGAAQAFVNPVATRFAFRANTLPASGAEIIHQFPGGELQIAPAGVLRFYPTYEPLGHYFDGSNALAPGSWYIIEAFSPVSGNITIRFYPDGSNPSGDEIVWTLPHDQNLSGVVQIGKATNRNGQTVSFDYDDVHATDGVAGYLGDGKIIRLGGNSSAPTYDGFVKYPSLSTIDQVWNDIPFPTLPPAAPANSNQTRAYSDSLVAVKQTIKHDAISVPDRIKAAQTCMWAELPADAFLPPTMEELHRVGGVDVTTPLNFIGREVLVFSWYIWPSNPSLADLNGAEVGVARGAGSTATMNIYDLWLEVEYGPDWTAPSPPAPDECLPPVIRDTDPDLLLQFQGSDIGLVFLFEGRFLSSTLYLWTGAGELEWDGKTWLGAGSLIGISQAKESSDLTAIGLTVSLSGVDEAIISAALQELRQGQICRIYIASYSWYPTRGLQSTPYCFFQGRVDVPTIDDGADTAVVSLQLENQLVDFERERVRFYDPRTQNVYFPGDRGFDYVAAIQDQKIFWGKSN
jgi:hypothetical protein